MQDIEITGEGKFLPLFCVPFGVYTDLNYENVKNVFLKMCYDEMNSDDGRIVSNRHGWQSSSDWFFQEKNSFFNRYIHKLCENLFYESFDHSGELSFTINSPWINISPFGAYNVFHTHPGCDYAAVFYIDLPKESYIVFESPSGHVDGLTSSMYSNEIKNRYSMFGEIELYPSEGTLLIFPSWMRHMVEENLSDTDRISIAFNIKIENYGRFGENSKRGQITC